MRRKLRFVVAACGAALLGALFVASWPPSQPVYEGRSLDAWLNEYDSTVLFAGGGATEEHANRAIRQIGTNAIPFLLDMLRRRDSGAKLTLIRFLHRHGVGIKFTLASDYNIKAEHGFEVLGAEARAAVPALIAILEEDVSPTSQVCAAQALGQIGEAASNAIPALVRCATNANASGRSGAIIALGDFPTRAEVTVPALVRCLGDTNESIRVFAVYGLSKLGPQARPAIPVLRQLLNNPDPKMQGWVSNALQKIGSGVSTNASRL